MCRRRDDTRPPMPTSLAELEACCEHEGGCWLWIFSSSLDTPQMRLARQLPAPRPYRHAPPVKVARAAWEAAHGRRVPDGMVVYRKCHEMRCVNPAHLVVLPRGKAVTLTAAAGLMRRRPDQRARISRSREQAGLNKLTAAQAAQILAQRGGRADEVAAQYGVSKSAVYSIWRGRRWQGVLAAPVDAQADADVEAAPVGSLHRAPPTVFEWAARGGRF